MFYSSTEVVSYCVGRGYLTYLIWKETLPEAEPSVCFVCYLKMLHVK